jgi:hypothetical protein
MGRTDSPLRDKVIFIEGAPRSGTTWLVKLMATHPRIAGLSAESHLFDNGLGQLFDNHERRRRFAQGVSHYLDRDELVDAVRDLCDRIFLSMRDHLDCEVAPDHVVEKTPVGVDRDGIDLERKFECYPDAWYIHILRDREAVTRSLMKAPFIRETTHEGCAALYDGAVANIRRCFGDSPRYRELHYEDLLADPVAGCADLFSWIGLETSEHALQTVAAVSREPVSELPPAVQESAGPRRSRVRRRVGTLVRPVRARFRPDAPAAAPEVAVSPLEMFGYELVTALRKCDTDGLRALTHPAFEYILRSPDGDVQADGDAAREALVELATVTFGCRHIGQWWAGSPAAPAAWWASAPSKPYFSVLFSTLKGDSTRVDMALGCALQDGLARRIVAITAGPTAGRPVVPLAPGA